MSRILVLILIFILFYQLSKSFVNLFRPPRENQKAGGRKPDPNVKSSTAQNKGYDGGEYIDYEEVE